MQTCKTFEEWKKLNSWISGVISPQFDFLAALEECWSDAKMAAYVEIEVMRRSYEAMAASDFAMRKRVVELDAQIADLRGRMEALLNKLDQVKKDTKGIFVMAQIHGIAYSGANWSDEYKACRELLAALDAPAGKGDSNGQA